MLVRTVSDAGCKARFRWGFRCAIRGATERGGVPFGAQSKRPELETQVYQVRVQRLSLPLYTAYVWKGGLPDDGQVPVAARELGVMLRPLPRVGQAKSTSTFLTPGS